jgi:NADH-quinone oxidoreductase subunit K
MFEIGLTHYLVVSAAMFTLGMMIIVMRRNAIAVLMGIEFLLNAAALNFVAFSRYVTGDLHGQLAGLFVIAVAAAEATIILAIILNIYSHMDSVNVDEADLLKQ